MGSCENHHFLSHTGEATFLGNFWKNLGFFLLQQLSKLVVAKIGHFSILRSAVSLPQILTDPNKSTLTVKYNVKFRMKSFSNRQLPRVVFFQFFHHHDPLKNNDAFYGIIFR